MVSSDHKMILSSGRFSGTRRLDLTTAMDRFMKTADSAVLAIHFHGGLVSEKNAEMIAERLLPVYADAGSYPLFVIWQAGLWETLQNNWREIVQEDVVPILIERVLQFVMGKLDQSPGEKGGDVELPTKFAVRDEIRDKQAIGVEPFSQRDPAAAGLEGGLTAAEERQFKSMLEQDSALSAAAVQLARDSGPDLEPLLQEELDKARDTADAGEKGILSTASLVAAGLRVLGRVLRRFAARRDHGIYTTVVEEVVRELKGDLLGGVIWKHMKKDTADAFDGSAEDRGGTALLAEINRIHEAGNRPRILLIGHSTGAVYICHLLRKARSMLPDDVRFEVVFLAPACTFDLFHRTLADAGGRIAAFRSFGMADDLETRDAIFPPLYLRSLLYFVSGLVEAEVDRPLVGMKRYHSGQAPFDAEPFPEIADALNRMDAFPAPWIWSENHGGPGRSTLSHKHGDFDNDAATLESVAHIIAKGAGS
jgi:hypothetical protein